MPSMQKMTATWSGFVGAPGTTSLYFQGNSIVPATVLQTFFDALKVYFPTTLTIQANNTGELVDPADGKVTGTWTSSSAALVTGTGATGNLLVSSGPQVRIETGAFDRGKHIRGRFYLIPCLSTVLAPNGYLAGTVITAIQAAADGLRGQSGGQLGVFHRPLKDYSVKPPVVKTPGFFIPSQSMLAVNKTAVLTSRRD